MASVEWGLQGDIKTPSRDSVSSKRDAPAENAATALTGAKLSIIAPTKLSSALGGTAMQGLDLSPKAPQSPILPPLHSSKANAARGSTSYSWMAMNADSMTVSACMISDPSLQSFVYKWNK